MTDDTNRLRRRLIAGGAGALATASLGTLSRAAFSPTASETWWPSPKSDR